MALFVVCCHHAQKPENGPISDLFNLTPNYFLPSLPYTDLEPPFTDPVPPRLTSTALYWPSNIMYQLLPPSTDPVPPSINKYRPILTQYHHVSTSTAIYWPSNTKYQPEPPSTDPVPSYINQCHSILTQYHQVSTSVNLYCCCMGITDFCTVYPGSC